MWALFLTQCGEGLGTVQDPGVRKPEIQTWFPHIPAVWPVRDTYPLCAMGHHLIHYNVIWEALMR